MEGVPSPTPHPTALLDFKQCDTCGRTFNADVLTRHYRICNKTKQSSQRRKPFDMNQQRVRGTQLEQFLANRPKSYARRSVEADEIASAKKKQWRRKHDDFVQTIRAARTITEAIQSGAPLPPHQPSAPNPDYVQCPHCDRRFQEFAAERHIPFCKEKSARIDIQPSSKAKASFNKRMQYKPPSVKKRLSTEGTAHGQHNPPGSSVVMKKTNFTGTYSLDKGGPPSSGQYEPASAHSRPIIATQRSPFQVKSPLKSTSHGSQSGTSPVRGAIQARQPHGAPRPPNEPPGSGVIRRTSYIKRGPMVPKGPVMGPAEEQVMRRQTGADEVERVFPGGGIHRGRAMHGDTLDYSTTSGTNNSGRFSSGSTQNGGTVGGSRRAKGQRPSENGCLASFSSSSSSDHDLPPLGEQHRKMESSRLARFREQSAEVAGGGSSHSSRNRLPLNQHGMPMSKYCYECGSKYPVPQAKYCCECGTQRI